MATLYSHYTIVSMGDAAGVGWLALKKIFSEKEKFFNSKELANLKNIIVVGDIFEPDKKFLKRNFLLEKFSNDLANLQKILRNSRRQKPLFLYLQEAKAYQIGKPTTALALRSYLYFQKSLQLFQKLPSALVTLPVSKEWIMRAGVEFVGHTEILEKTFQKKAVMCMYHPSLSVIPLTHHIPLARVSKEILQVDFEELTNAVFFFNELLGIKKQIAICGLNPHAGENGKIGSEEKFLLEKITAFQKKTIKIKGPLSADSLFMPQVRKNYSLILGNYHDQALIPFKALFGTKGLNITLNIPKLRVSPDHGPAYDLIYENIEEVDLQSVLNSLKFAITRGTKWMQAYSSIF